MKYKIDNDMHIHTFQSICSNDENQTPANILKYAIDKGRKTICIADHYWDSAVKVNSKYNWWYEKQNFEHISKSLPLPKADGVDFLFGAEVDLDSDETIGLPESRYDDFEFIVVSTTHFNHLTGPEWEKPSCQDRANAYVKRFDALLNMNLPFYKVGFAHPVCYLINNNSREEYLKTLDLIPTEELRRLFSKSAKLGLGIEINYSDMCFSDDEANVVLRPLKIAKECGCKFYLASDSHGLKTFEKVDEKFERAIDLLSLEEDDKFPLVKKG